MRLGALVSKWWESGFELSFIGEQRCDSFG